MRGIVALCALMVALGTAGAAQASGDQLSIAVAGNPSDAGVTVTASGSVSSSDDYAINVHYQAPGSCASDPDGNPPISPDGATVTQAPGAFTPVVGDPTLQQLLPATYTLCGWLVDLNTSTTVATTSTTITVVSADSISLSETPAPAEGREFDLYARGTNYDRGALLAVTFKPSSASCAADPLADTGTPANGNGGAAGAGSYSQDVGALMYLDPGNYIVCGWLYDQANPSIVLARTQQGLTVPGLSPNLQVHAPATVAKGGAFNITLSAVLPSGVPVEAVADTFAKHSGTVCPHRPPASVESVIDDQLADTTQPSGPVQTTTTEAVPLTGTTLVCAWLLDAWSNATTPALVAGPVAATVTVSPPLVFRGHTGQHRSMAIFTRPFATSLLSVQFGVRIHCNGTARLLTGKRWNGVVHQTISAFIFGNVRPDKSGRFKIRLAQNPNHTFTLQGRLVGKSIGGTFTESGRSWVYTGNHRQNLRCTSGKVKFSLLRG